MDEEKENFNFQFINRQNQEKIMVSCQNLSQVFHLLFHAVKNYSTETCSQRKLDCLFP